MRMGPAGAGFVPVPPEGGRVHVSTRQVGITVILWSLVAPRGLGADPLVTPLLRAVEIDFSRLAPLTRGAMRQELGQVLAPASLSLSWRKARTDGETERDELRFVFLPRLGVGTDTGALASTANSSLVRTTWIYVPNVAAALELDLENVATSFDAQRLLGIALGRVLAHEIVHAIAPDVEHTSGGLMRPGLDAVQLVRDRPSLTAGDSERLVARARAWVARAVLAGSDRSRDERLVAAGR
jgi:hypothetical protein